MAFTDAVMQAAAAEIQSLCTHAQLHSSTTTSNGTTNLTSAARVAIDWSTPTGAGDFGLDAPLAFTGIAASGPVQAVTLWDASTAGTYRGQFNLTGDTTANAAGEYTVTALNLDGTAA